MKWIDWLFLALNAVTYALGHYHGNNRGVAQASQAIGAAVETITAGQQQLEAQAAQSGAAAGAAAYEAGKQAGTATSKTVPPPRQSS